MRTAVQTEVEYKVIETSSVTDEEIERLLNQTVRDGGWSFDGIQFAMRDTSRRPSMAFLFFSRPRAEDAAG